jgi:hypothetical protein
MDLKPNSQTDFTHKLESEIIPLLRKQAGFMDEITFVEPGGKRAFAVSLGTASKMPKLTARHPMPK